MKSKLLKSILSFCVAIVFANTQFSVSAQNELENLTKEDAQGILYMITSQASEITNIGGIYINDFSYNGKILNMSLVTNDEDVRFFTSDFIMLQFHNLVHKDNTTKDVFVTISTLLRKSDSYLRIEYLDTKGHSIEHILTSNDIDDIISKSIEELGINKEQMSNYCIFYYNAIIKKNVDGINIIDAKAVKEGDFVKLTFITSYEDEIIDLFTPDLVKASILNLIGDDSTTTKGFANQLEAFGYKGIILEYSNQKGASNKTTFTNYELLNANTYSHEQSNTFGNIDLSSLGISPYTLKQYVTTLSDTEKKQLTKTFLESMEQGAKDAIGTNGITNVQVFLSGNYATILFSINGVSDLSESELFSIKQGLVQEFRNDKTMSTVSPIIQQATGIKGIKYIYKDVYSYKSATITINWDEISGSNNSYNDYSNSYSDNSYDYDFSDASTDELRDIFIQELDNSIKSDIGSDGISDAWVALSGESLVMNYKFDSTVDFSDIGDLNEIKNELIQYMTATDEDIEICYVLYYLDIKNIKVVLHRDNSRTKRSFTISIEDIVNGTFAPENVQYDEI